MRASWARGIAVGVLLLVAAGLVVWRTAGPEPASQPDAPADEDVAAAPVESTGEPAGDPDAEDVAAGLADALPELREAPRGAWVHVDMKALQRTIPNNLYWAMAMPTKDEALIEWRREERTRWNVEYGKVLSGTGTEEEVTGYYAYRQRLSNDYVEFAGYVLAHYGDKLSGQDKALLNLAMDMHMVRLEEIPRQLAEAQERRRQHEEARSVWLAEQQAFEGTPAAGK
jgi:hypothetical protein